MTLKMIRTPNRITTLTISKSDEPQKTKILVYAVNSYSEQEPEQEYFSGKLMSFGHQKTPIVLSRFAT